MSARTARRAGESAQPQASELTDVQNEGTRRRKTHRRRGPGRTAPQFSPGRPGVDDDVHASLAGDRGGAFVSRFPLSSLAPVPSLAPEGRSFTDDDVVTFLTIVPSSFATPSRWPPPPRWPRGRSTESTTRRSTRCCCSSGRRSIRSTSARTAIPPRRVRASRAALPSARSRSRGSSCPASAARTSTCLRSGCPSRPTSPSSRACRGSYRAAPPSPPCPRARGSSTTSTSATSRTPRSGPSPPPSPCTFSPRCPSPGTRSGGSRTCSRGGRRRWHRRRWRCASATSPCGRRTHPRGVFRISTSPRTSGRTSRAGCRCTSRSGDTTTRSSPWKRAP